MARRRGGVRRGGLHFDIKGLDEMLAGLTRGEQQINEILREILRGPVGDEIRDTARGLLARHVRTGATLAALDKQDSKRDGVSIGIHADAGRHPVSGAPYQSIGTWLESGRGAAFVQPRSAGALHIQGEFAMYALAGPVRAKRVMGTTLRRVRGKAENELRVQLERRLGRVMGTGVA